MNWWVWEVKGLVTKSGTLSSSPRTQKVEREINFLPELTFFMCQVFKCGLFLFGDFLSIPLTFSDSSIQAWLPYHFHYHWFVGHSESVGACSYQLLSGAFLTDFLVYSFPRIIFCMLVCMTSLQHAHAHIHTTPHMHVCTHKHIHW